MEEARIVGKPLPQEAEAPEHRHQKVVEIVRDAAGELSDGFHLLRLPELILYDASLFHFLENCGMRPTEFSGSLHYPLFERFVQTTEAGLGYLSLGDIRGDADQAARAALAFNHPARPDLSPMFASIVPNRSILDRVVDSSLDRVPDRRLHSFPIIRMYGLEDLSVVEIFLWPASEHGLAGGIAAQTAGGDVEFP
jgi:hypothetical protein